MSYIEKKKFKDIKGVIRSRNS